MGPSCASKRVTDLSPRAPAKIFCCMHASKHEPSDIFGFSVMSRDFRISSQARPWHENVRRFGPSVPVREDVSLTAARDSKTFGALCGQDAFKTLLM